MTTENKLLREFVHAADTQDPLFDAMGWIERARAALTQPAQPAEGGTIVGAILVDKESREGVMFYSTDMLPDPTTIKDRFELVKVYTAPPASQEPAKWCEYVAGMVDHWVRTDEYASIKADEDRCTKAIAGIIERRLWALKREASQEQAQQPSIAGIKLVADPTVPHGKFKIVQQPGGGEVVTRESALEAIEHVEQHNGPGRAAEARRMLATPKPEPMTDEPLQVAAALRRLVVSHAHEFGDTFYFGYVANILEACPVCHGSGLDFDDDLKDCAACQGSGKRATEAHHGITKEQA